MTGADTVEVVWTLSKDDGRAEVICVRLADAIELQYLIDSSCYYTERYGVVAQERERALRDAQAMREDFEARGWIDNSPSPPAMPGDDRPTVLDLVRPVPKRMLSTDPTVDRH